MSPPATSFLPWRPAQSSSCPAGACTRALAASALALTPALPDPTLHPLLSPHHTLQAAQSPNSEELAALSGLASKRQQQAAEERRPPIVAPEALIAMPALLPLFGGKKHSTFVVHADNPDPR